MQVSSTLELEPTSSYYGEAKSALPIKLQPAAQHNLLLWVIIPVILGLSICLLLLMWRCIFFTKGNRLDLRTTIRDPRQSRFLHLSNKREESLSPLPQRAPWFPSREELFRFVFPSMHVGVERELLSVKRTLPSAQVSKSAYYSKPVYGHLQVPQPAYLPQGEVLYSTSNPSLYDSHRDNKDDEAAKIAAFAREMVATVKAREEEKAARRREAEEEERATECLDGSIHH